jgi:hypothetical protein
MLLPRTNPLLATLLAALATPLVAQQPAEGYAANVSPLAAGTGPVALTTSGLVTFDGFALVLQAPGQPPATLLQFPSYTFGSFTLVIDNGHLLFGESSTGGLWLVPLQGGASPAPLAQAAFNYDATLLTANLVLVSAKTSGFGTPDNDLLVLDLGTGGLQQIASLPGASGAVTVAPNGDIYYATSSLAFPAPAGSTTVLRFRRPVFDTAWLNQTVLGLAQAEVVWSGLDAASDLAFDDDGDLLFVDWWNARIGELNDVDTNPSLGTGVLAYGAAPATAASLQYVPTPGVAAFEPFQPPQGTLWVHETDFGSQSLLRAVRSSQPVLTSNVAAPIPSGSFTLTVAGGPALGIGLLAFATTAAAGSVSLAVPGFEAPLGLSPALLGPVAIVPLGFDASGAAALTIQNPGFAPALAATAQVVVISPSNALGATAPLAVTIGS